MRSEHEGCRGQVQRTLAGGVLALGAWMAIGGAAWAGEPDQAAGLHGQPPRLCPDALVTVPIQIERWVEASAATVVVETAIAVNPAGAATARAEIATVLRRLVPEQPPDRLWRWTAAAVSRDSSGLARFTGRAEIRVPESAVGDIWERAKAASRPGLSVRVAHVQWVPSPADREAERRQARDQIYRLAREEAERIRAVLGGTWRVGRIAVADERSTPPIEAVTHEAARAESGGLSDIRADRLVVAATVELIEPRCAGSSTPGGLP